MKYKVKRLYKGFASVRDYIVKKCINKKKDLTLVYNNTYKNIPLEELKNYFQLHRRKFKSKFGSKEYELIDFKWDLDENQLTLLGD